MTAPERDLFQPPPTRRGIRRRRLRRTLAALAGLTVVAAGAWAGTTLVTGCGGIGAQITKVDGECIGLTDGSFKFDRHNAALTQVEDLILAENQRVRSKPYVRVVLLNPITWNATAPMSASETLHSVTGAYVGQYRANHDVVVGDNNMQIELILANEGSHEQGWRQAVGQIEAGRDDEHPIVAVIGLGVSTPETQQAAQQLSGHGIPMVGGALSGDSLTADAIPGLFNVSPGNRAYVKALASYVRSTHPALTTGMLIEDGNKDLYPRELAGDFADDMQKYLLRWPPLYFTGVSHASSTVTPDMFSAVVESICAQKPELLLFAGRQGDRTRFVDSLAERSCHDKHLYLLTAATGISSASFSTRDLAAANLSMIFATSDDGPGWLDGLDKPPSGFRPFLDCIGSAYGTIRPPDGQADLTDGYQIMYHDAMLTAARAIHVAATRPGLGGDAAGSDLAAPPPTTATPQAGDVQRALSNLQPPNDIPGASGTLTFSMTGGGRATRERLPVLETP